MNKISSSLLLLLFLVGIIFSSKAQDTTTSFVHKISSSYKISQARKDFDLGKVRSALYSFREAYNVDNNSSAAAFWIGKCHYRLTNYGYAIKYARIALKLKEKVDPEINYLIGQSFHRSMQLDSAIRHYSLALKNFSKMRAEELNVQQHLAEVERAKKWNGTPAQYKRNLYEGKINSGFDDYAPIIYDNGKKIYFAARRSNTTGAGVNPDDQLFFEDIYKGLWNSETKQWDSITNTLEKLNSDGFDAVSYVSPDGKQLYLTINNTMVPDQKKPTKSSDIYHSKLSKRGTWSSPRAVKDINSSFFDAGASLTADGLTMCFTSERKGTKGGSDLWISHSNNGKSWSEPENIGKIINTSGQETTPFITPDGKHLFFSSNKGNGIGGYDIYVAAFNGTQWSYPVNLGIEINTVNNDTHFRYYPQLKIAVLSSIRLVGKKASYDNFYIDMSNFKYPKFEFPPLVEKKK